MGIKEKIFLLVKTPFVKFTGASAGTSFTIGSAGIVDKSFYPEFITNSIILWLLSSGVIGTVSLLLFFITRKKSTGLIKIVHYIFLILWNLMLFLGIILLLLYIEIRTINYSSNGYEDAIINGNLTSSQLFFEEFKSSEDFVSNIQLENKEKYNPSILIYAIENKTPRYEEILQLAKQYGFSIEQKISFNYYEENYKKHKGKYIGKIFWIISEDYLGIKYNGSYTLSQYILGLSDADFDEEYLTVLFNNGFNFKEGITMRQNLLNFVKSAKCTNELYGYDENANFKKVYDEHVSKQESVLKILQDFYNKNK